MLEVGQLWMHRVTGKAYRVEQLVEHGAKMQPINDETHDPEGEPIGMTTKAISDELAFLPPVDVQTGIEIGVTSDGLVSIVKDGQRMFFPPVQLLAAALTGFSACKTAGIEITTEGALRMTEQLREALSSPSDALPVAQLPGWGG